MDSIEKRLREFQKIQELWQRSHWMNDLHPLGKLLISVMYIFTVVSFDKYALAPLILMAVYPAFGFIVGELSLRMGIYRMRLILPLVLFVGILNPFFDRDILFYVGEIGISGGVISMITLMLKGFYAVLAAYILIATTSIEKLCHALRLIHVPKIIVIVILLIERYFFIMGEEADRIATAYKLRAPRQKGIHYSAWGTLVGMWLIRSMDRAGVVYESMLLRGFKGDFDMEEIKARPFDIIYTIAWIAIFVFIRNIIKI
ncbi:MULTISPECIES: cobalt ECF transporter T component CbiQ [unclassified Butyrivibrio]|uniref:cobalt ECF transporter T component CbiQ n=1 Tax=unclassified Butyrivibrio TaxID=2639466 RepID=UPI0003F5D38F|nr:MULTISPECIES: cobalt ECF transporter T component CbiQ [unclassified Butyrivibrio]SEL50625.1 cobalt/nickel transport system permease protein [Butyrivibrio sp. ob235]